MPARKSVNQNDRIVTAQLQIAATKGWAGVSAQAVARAAKMKAADVMRVAPDRAALLVLLARYVDERVAAQTKRIDPAEPAKDRLFEVLMARFDVLQDKRAGMQAIMTGLTASPIEGVQFLPTLAGSMEETLHRAGMSTDPIKKIILTGFYLKTLTIWMKDESTDMAETMAELDRNLDLYLRLTTCGNA